MSEQVERVDARRNRALVLAAARRAFAERGASVTLAEIARVAGVGAGTVHRHFPTKSALLQAVLQERVDTLAESTAARLDAPDPGAAFFELLTEIIVSAPRMRALCELVESDDGWPKTIVGTGFRHALAALLTAARHQGSVRADIAVDDVLDLFAGCVVIQRRSRDTGRLARANALALDGLRPPVTKLDAVSRSETRTRNETLVSHCRICGSPMVPADTGRPPRYCSAACRQKAHRRRVARRSRAAM
ncbi:TetR/AcrR family transcriptional regulator [Nocardia panacis]|uniref:TetR/AcrR family transcriptional regulator n=1 Tax=Nocardia panacis TaxID=2340916 RepID=A0A3A4KJR9_9NOCA|nr:TetR/AcrR family transcriptional regulator [Nocardia panacis]RJO74911.1 TetR/AcrR family transcriptional regulator [Nocardia panacis]